jgi:hypothetical protein
LVVVPWITNFVKAQRIKLFGHMMKSSDLEYFKSVVEWSEMSDESSIKKAHRPRWLVGSVFETTGISALRFVFNFHVEMVLEHFWHWIGRIIRVGECTMMYYYCCGTH